MRNGYTWYVIIDKLIIIFPNLYIYINIYLLFKKNISKLSLLFIFYFALIFDVIKLFLFRTEGLYRPLLNLYFIGFLDITKASRLFANEVRIGGLGG